MGSGKRTHSATVVEVDDTVDVVGVEIPGRRRARGWEKTVSALAILSSRGKYPGTRR